MKGVVGGRQAGCLPITWWLRSCRSWRQRADRRTLFCGSDNWIDVLKIKLKMKSAK